jgi:high-affinity Fe2+/Pb2+ permease
VSKRSWSDRHWRLVTVVYALAAGLLFFNVAVRLTWMREPYRVDGLSDYFVMALMAALGVWMLARAWRQFERGRFYERGYVPLASAP